MHRGGPRFDCTVPSGGYAWWYIDALSDDGAQGLTLIAFVGSVFSPYYAWARRRGAADPGNHCALNVALYGNRSSRWTMTERGVSRVRREPSSLSIGASALRWTGSALEIDIDETCAPLPRRVRGKVRLFARSIGEQSFALDHAGQHLWTPLAPCAHVDVQLTEPAVNWSGIGYFDSNSGTEPLENAFEHWTWSRATLPDSTIILYDVHARTRQSRALALRIGAGGGIELIEPPPIAALPRTRWGISRQTRADATHGAQVQRTLEDAPFYSRSLLDTHLLGMRAAAIHESLNLNRFRAAWVRCLLPFRMPRSSS
jgi:carotenoid 1,2-hydratase